MMFHYSGRIGIRFFFCWWGGRGGGGKQENLEKNLQSKARTNNKLNPLMACTRPESNPDYISGIAAPLTIRKET